MKYPDKKTDNGIELVLMGWNCEISSYADIDGNKYRYDWKKPAEITPSFYSKKEAQQGFHRANRIFDIKSMMMMA